MKPDYVVCHYAEIGLKGKNRKFFEERLVENIKKALFKGVFKQVKRISGRIIIETDKDVRKELACVFGLSSFSPVFSCEKDIALIQKKALEVLKDKGFKTFKVDTRRSDKKFALTSQQVNEKVGEVIDKKVDLSSPDLTLFIEIVEQYCFLYTEKIKGLGGLPVSVSGKAVSLISGGIDSPVASFYAMKRGIRLVFCHFHALPYVDQASVDKVIDIVKVLDKYQFDSKTYLIPLADIQKEILLKTKEKLRVLLYRRAMFKISQIIAEKEKARTLVTGESVGQVASQTLPNMEAIEDATSILSIKPLICQDKEEIIQKAKEIGTYELSIIPHQDCCSRFLPKHPATKANLKEVRAEEKKIDLDKLIKKAIKNAKINKQKHNS